MIPVALGVAATIRVGYNVGAKDNPGARRAGLRPRSGAALAFAFLAASALLLMRDTIAGFYTTDAGVLASATALLFILALYQFVDDTQTTAIGCLRGYKDVRIPMIIVLIAHWGYRHSRRQRTGLRPVRHGTLGRFGVWWGLIIGFGVSTLTLNTRLAIIVPERAPDTALRRGLIHRPVLFPDGSGWRARHAGGRARRLKPGAAGFPAMPSCGCGSTPASPR